MTEEERYAQAGEYVLGTLPIEERAAFERAMQGDAALRAAVRDWEERLVGLTGFIAEIAPPAGTWRAIEGRLGAVPRAAPVAEADLLRRLRRSRARWRGVAASAMALAAGLALFIGTGHFGERGATYLAVVNRGGDLPALVVQVDTRADIVTVRSVSAETPPDSSLQLWYIGGGGAAPRSLGLVDSPRRQAILPAVARQGDIAGASIAVSVEPKGGSPTGLPTGPVVYSGKLIAE